MLIKQKRLINLNKLSAFNLDTIQLGVPATSNEPQKLNLSKIGDSLIPSADFGNKCSKNAYGYSYPDKTKPKAKRYICTNWIQPFGNEYAFYVPVDIYRKCYPKIEVAPTEIELLLSQGVDGKEYIIANLTPTIRTKFLLEAINVILEIFGECYVFENGIQVHNQTRRCNWEILPPGEKPGVHLRQQLERKKLDTNIYDIDRLNYLDEFTVEQRVEGTNGFNGYYAYIFKEPFCVLESAIYGNATYIIPKEDWEILSQKTKQELFAEDKVLFKIIHNADWKNNFKTTIKQLGYK